MTLDYIIVGSGFSSHLFSSKLNKNFKVIGPKKIGKEFDDFKINKIFHTKKILSEKSISVTKNKFELHKNIKLHDYLINGGSSNLWGGVVDLKNKDDENILKNLNLKLVKLSLNETFSYSKNNNYFQIRNQNNKIASFENNSENFINGFVKSFKVEKDFIIVNYYCFTKKEIAILRCKKIILALNAIQLIELLVNSDLIKNEYIFSLDEFYHNFKLSFSKVIRSKEAVIKYNLIGAIKHFLGYQKKLPSFLNYFLIVPIYVEQTYYNKKNTLNIQYKDGKFKSLNDIHFGDSIHYSNLKINNERINSFLKRYFGDKAFVISMPGTNQDKPGPIINDIIKNLKKILEELY